MNIGHTNLLLEAFEPDDEVRYAMVRQCLPCLDVVELGLSWTKTADVVVCRQDSLKQLVTQHEGNHSDSRIGLIHDYCMT